MMKRVLFFGFLFVALSCLCVDLPAQTAAESIASMLRQIDGLQSKDSALIKKASQALLTSDISKSELQSLERDVKSISSKVGNSITSALLFNVFTRYNRMGELYLSIDKTKELIVGLENSSDTYDRYLSSMALFALRIPYRNSDRIDEGISYYIELANKYQVKNDSQLASVCYYVLGGFFRTNGLVDKSIYYQQKSIQYLNPNEIVRFDYIISYGTSVLGLVGAINHKAVLASTFINNGQAEKSLNLLYEAKALCDKHHGTVELVDEPFVYLQILRAKIQMRADSIDYYLALTEKMTRSDNVYAANFFQTKGYYFYEKGLLDSAEIYFNNTLILRDSSRLGANTFAGELTPGYYLALVKIKQRQYSQAASYLEREIAVLKASNLRITTLKELRLLASIYKDAGDYKSAAQSYEAYETLHTEVLRDEAKNRDLTFDLEQSIAEREKAMKELASENAFNRTTKYYLFGIAGLIALLALRLYTGYRAKQKANTELEEKNAIITEEKHRSEELLLNILPAEVAEELKSKGSADAKQFADVTVMFTDFKNFTLVSEKMNAVELVKVINHCYSAFDTIITKHNIEKIKTIGDSYMCAGGLPVENRTNAVDVVSAALEIQEFMSEHHKQRRAEGKELFEIRIGIHTGPVVAGIVGIRKFAYDIWGDTVNIASRMESGGEAGKVNISGSTYELVKDHFKCSPRGKIEAKNKGSIEMYFVESKVK